MPSEAALCGPEVMLPQILDMAEAGLGIEGISRALVIWAKLDRRRKASERFARLA